jgi:hypothetical protein
VVLPESDSHPSNNQNEKQNLAITPKTFVAEEMIDEQKVTLLQTSFFFDILNEFIVCIFY